MATNNNQQKSKIVKVQFSQDDFIRLYPELSNEDIKEFIRDQFQGAAQSFRVQLIHDTIEILWGIPREYSEADELNKEALEFARAQKYKEAFEKWKQAIEINPVDPDFHYNIGLAFFQVGHFDQGIEYCQETIEICPVYYKAYFVLGSLYSRKRQYVEAEQILLKALMFNPKNVNGLVNLGAVYSVLKENDKAKKWFEKALQYSPDELKAYFGLGKLYAAEKDYENANRCLKAVIKLDPESTMGMLAKRSIHTLDKTDQNELKSASKEFSPEMDSKQQPEDIDIDQVLAQGYHYYIENQIDKAVEKYTVYLKHEKNDADIWASLASCYYRLQNFGKGVKCIQRAIQLNPGRPYYYKLLAMLYDVTDQPADAGSAAQKAFSLGKRDSVVLTLLAIAKKEKHFTESTQLLQEAVSLDGNNLKARYHLGTVLIEDNQHEAAYQQFEEILWSDIESPIKADARKQLKLDH
ncbi:MAG: tetratricopeptide repeat protein [candidate division KSB1 bacterium]|nr:tetratricopeptide repeat protein [candidate division KSB1 bacterium]